MRVAGVLLALFGAGGLVTGVVRVVNHMHVEPIGVALLGFMTVAGVMLFRFGGARAAAQRRVELAVLQVAEKHSGRVTPVLVASEAAIPIAAAERELARLAESGMCVRRTDEAGACFLFPEIENPDVKRKLFF